MDGGGPFDSFHGTGLLRENEMSEGERGKTKIDRREVKERSGLDDNQWIVL